MEIKILKVPEEKEERVLVECHEVTSQVSAIVRFVKSVQQTITGEDGDCEHEISIQDIYYIESVDGKTYIYTKNKVYRTRARLYELEERLADSSFLRITKATVLNLLKITAIKPALSGRFCAVLSNGEEVIISRKYVADLKQKIRGGKV